MSTCIWFFVYTSVDSEALCREFICLCRFVFFLLLWGQVENGFVLVDVAEDWYLFDISNTKGVLCKFIQWVQRRYVQLFKVCASMTYNLSCLCGLTNRDFYFLMDMSTQLRTCASYI